MGFFKHLIKELVDAGHTVDIACNDSVSKVNKWYYDLNCKVYSIRTARNPLDKGNLVAIKQIRNIVTENKYDIVHCHTPVAAMCTRIACRKLRMDGIKVYYTAHGFHFYKGAPIKHWLMYYPVEKMCSYWTDLLITINKEDYQIAEKKLKAKRVEYVPGVGIDISRFRDAVVDRNEKRRDLGVPEEAFLVASVGELNKNKNHEIIIRALASINDKNIYYCIAGKGPSRDYLLTLAEELGVGENVKLLGHRKDIPEIYKSADACALPSYREGLPLAAIEGMASGLPLIVSDNRGAKSLVRDGVNAIICPIGANCIPYAEAIIKLRDSEALRKSMGEFNKKESSKYEVKDINMQMKKIYGID